MPKPTIDADANKNDFLHRADKDYLSTLSCATLKNKLGHILAASIDLGLIKSALVACNQEPNNLSHRGNSPSFR